MKVVLCNGCFDLLHYGHLLHLREARKMGDRLVVSLTRDAHVNKGPRRPVYKWAERAAMLREWRCVSEVIPSDNAVEAIEKVRPDVFVKGVDYKSRGLLHGEIEVCERLGVKIRFTTAKKLSATEAIKRASA